jgi:hypothetical protein
MLPSISMLFVVVVVLATLNSTHSSSIPNNTNSSSFIIRDANDQNESSSAERSQPVALAQTQSEQPDIKWITPSDFLELIRYLFDQAKTIPYTNYLIIDTRNSNEYNGWKSFEAIYSALDFNRTG